MTKLPGIDPETVATLRAQSATPIPPYANDLGTAKDIFEFLADWRVNEYAVADLDCQKLGIIPTTLRQKFYGVKYAINSNTSIVGALQDIYGADTYLDLAAALNSCSVSCAGKMATVTRGGKLTLATSYRKNAPQTKTLRTRFLDWVNSDDPQPFEARGEAISGTEYDQLEVLKLQLGDAFIIALTPNSLLARRA